MLEFAFEDEEQQWGKMVGFDECEWTFRSVKRTHFKQRMLTHCVYMSTAIEIPYHLQPPNYEDSDSELLSSPLRPPLPHFIK